MERDSFLRIGTKSVVIVMLITATIIIVDSTIVKLVAYGSQQLSNQSNVATFIIISCIFVAISIWILSLINQSRIKDRNFRMWIHSHSYIIASIVMYSIISLLILIILQMLLFNNYSILSLLSEIYVIHISAMFFLIFLITTLLNWFKTRRNRVVILYSISFLLLTSSILISLIYLTYDFSFHISYKKPYSFRMFLLNLPRADLVNSFGPVLDVLLLTSFLSMWIATTDLLSQYRRRFGKIRYWILMTIPLIYFLFPFETYFLNIMNRFMLESPVFFALFNVLTFSATKQVGGILFATVFITASTIINRPKLKNSLILSGLGVLIFYSSVEIDTLIYAVYPPFGLVSILLMPIGACLILNGILMSARQMSLDAELRKEFYSRAESQLSLLKTIGLTQMETQLVKNCRHLFERFSAFERSREDQQLEQEDMKQVIKDVLAELQSKSNRTSKND